MLGGRRFLQALYTSTAINSKPFIFTPGKIYINKNRALKEINIYKYMDGPKGN